MASNQSTSRADQSFEESVKEFREFMKKNQDLDPLEGYLTHQDPPPSTDWSDQTFYKLLSKTTRYKTTFSESVTAAKIFVRVYSGDSVEIREFFQTVMAILIRSQTEKRIDLIKQKEVEPSTSSDETGGEFELTFTTPSSEFTPYFSPVSAEESEVSIDGMKYNAQTLSKWYTECMNILDGTDDNKKKDLISLIGFLILNLIRLVSKPRLSVQQHIGRFINARLENLYASFLKPLNPFPLPSGVYIYRLMENLLSDYSEYKNAILIPFINNLIDPNRKDVIPTLNAGAFVSLAYTGLGLINWSCKASIYLKIDFMKVMDCCSLEYTFETIKMILEFLNSHKDCQTWKYARLLVPTALSFLSNRQNWLLACMFVCMSVEADDIDDIFTAKSLSKAPLADRNYAKSFAVYMKEHIRLNKGGFVSADRT